MKNNCGRIQKIDFGFCGSFLFVVLNVEKKKRVWKMKV